MAASAQTAWKWKFEPFAPGFVHVTPPARPACAACRRTDACTMACLDLLEQAIVEEHPETVAAVIAEPVMLSAGVHVPHPEYFPRLREVCDRHNVLLIYDEIITGFGRTGRLFGAERVGAWPDILTCGKGISGGYAPLSAILIADRVGEAFWGEPEAGVQFWAGHTFGGNPVSCAVGEAAVRYLLDHDLIGNAERVGCYLADRIADIAARQAAIAEVRGAPACCAGWPSWSRSAGGLRRGAAARAADTTGRGLGGGSPPAVHHAGRSRRDCRHSRGCDRQGRRVGPFNVSPAATVAILGEPVPAPPVPSVTIR